MGAAIRRGFERVGGGRVQLRRTPDIFISHASVDKALVRTLSGDLNLLGVDVWLDEWELEAGDSLSRCLGQALESSRFVGVVITPTFCDSEWCLDELGQALSREKRSGQKVVIPLLAHVATPPPLIEDRINVNLLQNYEKAVAELSAVVHGINRRRLSECLAVCEIRSLGDAYEVLVNCGWDQVSLFEADDIAALRSAIASLEPNSSESDPDTVWLSRELLAKLASRRDLRVVRELSRLDGPWYSRY